MKTADTTPRDGLRRESSRRSRPGVRKVLGPGERGTRKLLAEYGDRLVCVRYRHDPASGLRWKTAEIVVAHARRVLGSRRPAPARATDGERQAGVRLEPWEDRLRDRLQGAGARWDRELRLWRVAYDRALRLGIQERLISLPQKEEAATRRNL